MTPDNLTDSASDGIGGGTGCNFIFFTVPTTCSRPSIEMVGRVHSPGKTVLDQEVEHGPKVLKFTVDEYLGYGNFE